MAKPLKKRVKNDLIFLFVFYLILFVRLLPREAAFKLFEKLGQFSYYVISDARNKMIAHLTLAFGNQKSPAAIRKMAKETFVNLGRNAVDALRLPIYSLADLEKIVAAEGLDILDQVRRAGRSIILITGHIGSWEVMAGYIAMRGYPLYVVGARLYDPRLDRLLLKMRKSGGYINIPRGGSTKFLLHILHRPNLLGLLMDQDTHVAGTFVDFFGKPAYTPVGPVILAEKTGAALIPIFIQLDKTYTHRIKILPEFKMVLTGDKRRDVMQNTQGLTKIIEEFIRTVPTQWVWMHERWKTRPEDVEQSQ
ncbi:MAG: lysophospholipid acyltransferase family protein [Calditrichaeota bacterium]|nr:lysophospholipid acyltransferase family protein [Calditrichota bacterium]